MLTGKNLEKLFLSLNSNLLIASPLHSVVEVDIKPSLSDTSLPTTHILRHRTPTMLLTRLALITQPMQHKSTLKASLRLLAETLLNSRPLLLSNPSQFPSKPTKKSSNITSVESLTVPLAALFLTTPSSLLAGAQKTVKSTGSLRTHGELPGVSLVSLDWLLLTVSAYAAFKQIPFTQLPTNENFRLVIH